VYPLAAPDPVYRETIHITKDNIQVIAPIRDIAVVPPVGGDPSFLVEANYVVIRGFEMTGPSISIGILFEGSHNTFADNVIHPSFDPDVNAIVATETGGSNDNIIENNTIYDSKYGIVVLNGMRFIISGNSISTPQVAHGIQLIADNDGVQGILRHTLPDIFPPMLTEIS
jgi:parallel beta-helix repeat protein